MKKLSLKMKGIGEMLTREQMKMVLGGDGMGGNGACPTPTANNCSTNCPCTDHRDWCDNGLCKTRT
jgi:hypothetical protein